MNVSNDSKVNLNDLISRVEREGNSTGLTNKTFGDLVAYAKNSGLDRQCAQVGAIKYLADRRTGIGAFSPDGKHIVYTNNDCTSYKVKMSDK